ncbi:MAG TPA: PRC-barrel domain-containing protein [Aestuariivirga sp.]|nr:PRC-barrel domain-containing protein [Aestuariivirga sp.]
MNNFRNTVAVLALLCASGMAYAQEATPAAPAPVPEVQNKADCPPAGTVPEADLSAECKAAGSASNTQPPAASTDPMTTGTTTPAQENAAATPAPAPAPDAATTTVGNAQVNPADAVLASQFMGQAVYTAANENIGEINDLIMNKELDNIVAVVGVGGFLGIGERDVAIPISDIKVIKDADNSLRLTITASKEQLEALPAFDRTAMK